MPIELASNAGFTNCRRLLLEANAKAMDKFCVDCRAQIVEIDMRAALVPKGQVLNASK